MLLHLLVNEQQFQRAKQGVKGSCSLTSCLSVPQLLDAHGRSKGGNLHSPTHRSLCFRSSLCYRLTLLRENKHFPWLHKWTHRCKRNEVIFQKVTSRNEGKSEPSFPGTAPGEPLDNPEEGLKQPHEMQQRDGLLQLCCLPN